MKNSNYNTQQHFESLIEGERNRVVPTINVRSAVRMALQREQSIYESQEVSDVLVQWFSGIRGFVATGLAVASVAALAMIVFTQIDTFSDDQNSQDNDELTAFIDNGDWSALL